MLMCRCLKALDTYCSGSSGFLWPRSGSEAGPARFPCSPLGSTSWRSYPSRTCWSNQAQVFVRGTDSSTETCLCESLLTCGLWAPPPLLPCIYPPKPAKKGALLLTCRLFTCGNPPAASVKLSFTSLETKTILNIQKILCHIEGTVESALTLFLTAPLNWSHQFTPFYNRHHHSTQ